MLMSRVFPATVYVDIYIHLHHAMCVCVVGMAAGAPRMRSHTQPLQMKDDMAFTAGFQGSRHEIRHKDLPAASEICTVEGSTALPQP